MVRRALAESLGRVLAGAEIAEVGSLAEATAALDDGVTDLLLLDLQMPGMNGLASLAGLRGAYPAARSPVAPHAIWARSRSTLAPCRAPQRLRRGSSGAKR